MINLLSANAECEISQIRAGQALIIQRKRDGRKIIVKCVEIANDNEVILSKGKNDYFNFDMYMEGKSWVWRVWVLPCEVELTAITNNTQEFPR